MTEPRLQPSGSPGPEAVNAYHERADVDTSPLSLHHTLGQQAVQSSPGNHGHTGVDSQRINPFTSLAPLGGIADGVLIVGSPTGWGNSPSHSAGDRPIAKPGVGQGLQWTKSPGCLMPVRTVATTNQSVATPGTPTTDGVAWASGDRVLLTGQTAPAENGVYVYSGSANPLARAADADLAATLAGGILVPVLTGTLFGGVIFRNTTTAAITLGTTALGFARQDRRVGCRIRRVAAQAITTATLTAANFDTEDEDTDGFFAPTSTTVTIPAGKDGVYSIMFYVGLQFQATARNFVDIQVTSSLAGLSNNYRSTYDGPTAEVRGMATFSGPLVAGDSFVGNVFQSTGANQNLAATLTCYQTGA